LIICYITEVCDYIYHLDCVKPILHEIPHDSWACSVCVPTAAEPRGTRRVRNAPVNYNEATPGKTDPANDEPVIKESEAVIRSKNAAARAARASNRNKVVWEDSPGTPHAPVPVVDLAVDDGRRRSGRTRRVDYKDLIDGNVVGGVVVKKNGLPEENGDYDEDEAEVEEETAESNHVEPEEEEMFSVEENVESRRRSSSEDSEFDPDTKPRWGKKHRPKR